MNKRYGNNTRNSKKSIQYTREDVKNSDTKQHISYKHTTASNTEELNQRKINITAKTKILSGT